MSSPVQPGNTLGQGAGPAGQTAPSGVQTTPSPRPPSAAGFVCEGGALAGAKFCVSFKLLISKYFNLFVDLMFYLKTLYLKFMLFPFYDTTKVWKYNNDPPPGTCAGHSFHGSHNPGQLRLAVQPEQPADSVAGIHRPALSQ